MFRFNDLPYDLRETIWKLCLPRRVFEVDELMGEEYMTGCRTKGTSRKNTCAPVIAHVCQESRRIAAKSLKVPDPPPFSSPCPTNLTAEERAKQPLSCLVDSTRDTPNLYYNLSYDDDVYWRGLAEFMNPLTHLSTMASQFRAREACISLEYLNRSDDYPFQDDPQRPNGEDPPISSLTDPSSIESLPDRKEAEILYENAQALERLPLWRIAMDIIYVHCDARKAAASGLFGLFADAPIQIVDAQDESAMAAYIKLAQSCDEEHPPELQPDYSIALMGRDLLRRQLFRVVWTRGYPTHLWSRMQPAIIFRLCTQDCYLHDFI